MNHLPKHTTDSYWNNSWLFGKSFSDKVFSGNSAPAGEAAWGIKAQTASQTGRDFAGYANFAGCAQMGDCIDDDVSSTYQQAWQREQDRHPFLKAREKCAKRSQSS